MVMCAVFSEVTEVCNILESNEVSMKRFYKVDMSYSTDIVMMRSSTCAFLFYIRGQSNSFND